MKNIIIITFKGFILQALLIIVINIITAPVFASEIDDIGFSKIHPASPFYFLKTIREDLELKFAQTTQPKRLKEAEIAFRRIREAKTLINIDQNLIPPTLERYLIYLNDLANESQGKSEISLKIKDDLSIHLKILQQMYAQVSNLRAKMTIRSVMSRIVNKANLSINAKLPVCNFFLKESSSSALNQTEQAVYKDRAQNCLNSLQSISF